MSWESKALELLSASLLRPLVLVVVALVILRVFRVKHPASKHAVWTAVLIGILLLPILSVFTPHLEFEALPHGTLARINDFTLPEKSQLTTTSDDGTSPASLPENAEASSATDLKTAPPVTGGTASSRQNVSAGTILSGSISQACLSSFCIASPDGSSCDVCSRDRRKKSV